MTTPSKITLNALPHTDEYRAQRNERLQRYKGEVDKLKLLAEQVSEKDPEHARSPEALAGMLHEVLGGHWHQNARYRAGVRAKHCDNCDVAGTILGIDRLGVNALHVMDDDPSYVMLGPVAFLGPVLGNKRLSLAEYGRTLLRYARDMRGECFTVAKTLHQLFRCSGGYMPRNFVGEAWMLYATMLLSQWPESDHGNEAIISLLGAAVIEGEDLQRYPPAFVRVFNQQSEGETYSSASMTFDQIEAAYQLCLTKVEEFAIEQFVVDADAYEATPLPHFESGDLAWLAESDQQVVVLCEPAFSVDDGFLNVGYLESGQVTTVHASELLPEEDRIEPGELMALVADNGALEYYLCLCLVDGRLGFKKPVPALLKVMVYVTGYRWAYEAGGSTNAKAFLQLAKAEMKLLASADKSKAFALCPELLPPKKGEKTRPRGPLNSCRLAAAQMFAEVYAEELHGEEELPEDEQLIAAVLPSQNTQELEPDVTAVPEPERVLEVTQPAEEISSTPAQQASNEDAISAEPEAGSLEQASSSDAEIEIPIRSKRRSASTLRFPSQEYKLQALEWTLEPGEESFGAAVASTLAWLGTRLGTTLPERWSHGGHELELGGVRLEIEAGKGVFAFRMEHPDRELLSRTWRLESMIIAGPAGNTPMVGVRVSAVDRDPTASPPFTGVPALTGAWQESPGLLIGGVNAAQSIQVRTKSEFDRWVAEVLAPKRTYVMTATLDPSGFVPPAGMMPILKRGTFSVPAADLYREKYGYPNQGAIHVFRAGYPGPSNWQCQDRKALNALMLEATSTRQRPDTPTFKQIRDLLRDTTPKPTATEPEPTRSEEQSQPVDDAESIERIAGYRNEELQSMLDMALADNDQTQRELQQAKSDLAAANTKIIALQAQLAIKGPAVAQQISPPKQLVDLPEWVATLAPRVLVAEKALRIATQTEHNEPEKIIASLSGLAEHYWPSRFAEDPEGYERWNKLLAENNLRWSPVGTATDDDRYAAQYQCVVDGKTYTATHHVRGSSSRNPSRCIRIYVAIDPERMRLVVVHLPTHLDNKMT